MTGWRRDEGGGACAGGAPGLWDRSGHELHLAAGTNVGDAVRVLTSLNQPKPVVGPGWHTPAAAEVACGCPWPQGFPDHHVLLAKPAVKGRWTRNDTLTQRYQQMGNAVW